MGNGRGAFREGGGAAVAALPRLRGRVRGGGRPHPAGPLRAVLRPLWAAPARGREKIPPRRGTPPEGRERVKERGRRGAVPLFCYGGASVLLRVCLWFASLVLSISGSFRAGNPRIFPVIPGNERERLQVKGRIEDKPRLSGLYRVEYAAALPLWKLRAFPDMPLHPHQQARHKAIFQP